MTSSYDAARATMEYAKKRRADPREVWGLPWGFPTLDRMTGGIHDGELTILGAETGAGKSALLGQIALSVARHLQATGSEKRVRLVHCEMTLLQFNTRLACMLADVPAYRINTGRADDAEFERFHAALTDIAQLPIDYRENIRSIDDTVAFIQEEGCAWWAVDHMQIHPVRGGYLSTSNDGIAILSKEFAKLSRDVAPGMVLSQLTNDVAKRENHRPTKGDLYGGKMIQADASVILLLFRPDIYTETSDEERAKMKFCQLLVDKNRSGQNGELHMMFNPLRTSFRETEKQVKKDA